MALPLDRPNLRPQRRFYTLWASLLGILLLIGGGHLAAQQPAMRLLRNDGHDSERYSVQVAQLFQQASDRIAIMVYVIRPEDDGDGPVHTLCHLLAAAQERGVSVHVVADASNQNATWPGPDNSAALAMLQAAGVSAHPDAIERRSHSKMVVVDDHVIIGSHNWTYSALTRNREHSLWVHDAALADRIFAEITAAASNAYTSAPAPRKPLP